MEVKKITEISPKDITVECKSVMSYSPKIRKNSIINRQTSSFLFIKTGTYLYEFANMKFTANAGSVVYIPAGSKHKYTILTEDTQCIQIEVDFTSNSSREVIVFSEHPKIILENSSGKILELFENIDNAKAIENRVNDFLITAYILELLAYFSEDILEFSLSEQKKKIRPAMKYIERNYNKKIYVSELAKMCLMSESQIRRIFKKEINMSPIQFKNKICIKTACSMLKMGYYNITEISEALGYDNIYFFSKTFKNIMGISPKKYMER